MKKIIFLTNYKKIIPQRHNEIEGLNLNLISEVLEASNFSVQEITINTFITSLKEIESLDGIYFYYTSSQYQIYKSFILDVLIQITLRGGILVPEIRHFLAHENKNFQELEKVRLGIRSPYGIPVGTYEEGVEILKNIAYPTVLKKHTGFRSRNVKLANNFKEGKKVLSKLLEKNFLFDMDSLYFIYRRLKNKEHYPKKFGKLIIQEFIPDLTHDWKILVLGDRCLGGKRYVRKNDFRASGSKLYEMDEDPPENVLSFALKCKQQLSCPNVSLDISENKGDLQLLEYQTMHFAILGGDPDYYFEREDGIWQKREITKDIEYYMGVGISDYIKNMEKTIDLKNK
jgi:glutathione synthase/RimK-type ligase-like ATP-grasp enzyme